MLKRYRNLLKWTLYTMGFLLVLLLESSALGAATFAGTKLSLLPAYVCCVACREGHEAGGLFSLCASVFWALSGVTGGPVVVALLPLSAVLCAYCCNVWLNRSLPPVLAGCLFTLALCQGAIYLTRRYMGNPMPPDALRLLGRQIGISMLPAPLFWWATRLMEKAGGARGT